MCHDTPRPVEVGDGGGVEVFLSSDGAQRRGDYIREAGKQAPALVEYDYVEGSVLLRLSSTLVPADTGAYQAALKNAI